MILAVDHGLRRKTKFDQAVARVLESGWGTPTPAEIKARQQAIIAQADLLDKFADSSLSAMVRDQLAIEQVFEKLIRELGTKAPDALVSGIAHGRARTRRQRRATRILT